MHSPAALPLVATMPVQDETKRNYVKFSSVGMNMEGWDALCNTSTDPLVWLTQAQTLMMSFDVSLTIAVT